ncbi:unnamed protein product, partial [Rotaria magnacalcarata]
PVGERDQFTIDETILPCCSAIWDALKSIATVNLILIKF